MNSNKKDPISRINEKIRMSNSLRFVISLALAVMCWLVVVIIIQPDTNITLERVPVNFSYATEEYINNGFTLVSHDEMTVSLRIEGDGAVIGGLTKEDFIIYPDYSSVKNAGEASMKLIVEALSPDASRFTFYISGITSTAKAVFDTVTSKKIPIDVTHKSLEIEDGYVLVQSVPNVSNAVLTGPTNELNTIAKAVVKFEFNKKLNANATYTGDIIFLDSKGDEVEFVDVKSNVSAVDIEFVVYKKAELPITVDFINTPINFDESVLGYSFNHETLKIVGDENIINSLTEISVGTIDLSTFLLDKIYELPIELPKGIQLQENITNVLVSFDTTDLSTTVLNIPERNIKVNNLPTNYSIDFESKRIMNVQLVGPKDIIAGLSANSVVALIDMDNYTLALGEQTVPVSIYVPSNGKIFPIGNYTIQCTISSE